MAHDGVVNVDGKSGFMQSVRGKDVGDALKVLDEHMDAIFAIYPQEYSALIEKIKTI